MFNYGDFLLGKSFLVHKIELRISVFHDFLLKTSWLPVALLSEQK